MHPISTLNLTPKRWAIVAVGTTALLAGQSLYAQDLETVRQRVNAGYCDIMASHIDPFYFAYDHYNAQFGSETFVMNQISDGGNDMYDAGHRMNTDRASMIPYSDNEVKASSAFGEGSAYFTRHLNGMWVLAADVTNITSLFMSGNLGADGMGTSQHGSFTINVGGIDYGVYFRRVYNAWDPSINQLILVPNYTSLAVSASPSTDNGQFTVSMPGTSTRIYSLLFARPNGGYCDNTYLANVAQDFLFTITNSAAPELDIYTSPRFIGNCLSESQLLTVENVPDGATVQWQQYEGFYPYHSSTWTTLAESSPELMAEVSNERLYRASVTHNGCTVYSNVVGVLTPDVPLASVLPTEGCNGQNVQIAASETMQNGESLADFQLKWYSQASGGEPFHIGNTLDTVMQYLTLYVESEHGTSGCVSTSRLPVYLEPTFNLNVQTVTTNVSCFGGSNGSIQAVPGNGTAPYVYSWSNGAATASVSDLSVGVYSVQVTDATGCRSTANTTVVQPAALQLSINPSPATTCNEAGDGSAVANPTGGTAPYSIEWSNGQTGSTATELEAGNYMLSVTDANGCRMDRGFNIDVNDQTAPVVLAQSTTAYLNSDGYVDVTPEMIDAGSYDDCELAELYVVGGWFACGGSIADVAGVELVGVDAAGNSASALVEVTVLDTIRPVAQAPTAIEVELSSNGIAEIFAADLDQGSYDNCVIDQRALSQSVFTCDNLGENTVEFTVTDPTGNSHTVPVTVVVTDNIAPDVYFEEMPLLYLDANGMAYPSAQGMVTDLVDNCEVVSFAFEQEFFDCSHVGSTEFGVTVQDAAGNSTTRTWYVDIQDTLDPAFNLSQIELALNENGEVELTSDVLMPFASDNCGVQSISINQPLFTCSQVGQVIPTNVLIRDVHGNEIERIIQVEITDDTMPTLNAQGTAVSLNSEGTAELNLESVLLGASDNCGIVTVELSQQTFDCSQLGDVDVVVTATDNAGNQTSVTVTVTVQDLQAPEIACVQPVHMCPGQLQLQTPEVSDNCEVTMVQVAGPLAGDELAPGQYTVRYEATDAAGNLTACEVPVFVFAAPLVDLGEDLEVPAGNVVTLSAPAGEGFTYLWSTGQTDQSIEVVVSEDMVIDVQVISANGCSAFDEIAITARDVSSVATDERGNRIVLFPNPTAGNLDIRFELPTAMDDVEIALMDIQGKVIERSALGTAQHNTQVTLNLSGLANGIYFVQILGNDLKLTERIVKQ